MKGFLKKDLYLTIGYCRSIFLIVAVFIVIGCVQTDNWFFVFYPAIMVSLLAVTLLSYDEREHFCPYAAAMPQSRAAYVSAKYIISLTYGLICVAVIVMLQAIFGEFIGKDILFLVGSLLILVLFTPAVALPFMFKFGVEKGRLAYYVMIGFSTAAALLLMNTGYRGRLGGDFLFALLGVGAVILFAISWLLSIRFYTKREF